jgi:hypothetical protein
MPRAAKPDKLSEAAGREGGFVETDLITTIVVGIDFGQRRQSVGV